MEESLSTDTVIDQDRFLTTGKFITKHLTTLQMVSRQLLLVLFNFPRICTRKCNKTWLMIILILTFLLILASVSKIQKKNYKKSFLSIFVVAKNGSTWQLAFL